MALAIYTYWRIKDQRFGLTNDPSGATLQFFIFAPVSIPVYITVSAISKINNARHQRQVREISEATKWIASELKKKGITIHSATFEEYLGCSVKAEIVSNQRATYQKVYAAATKKFRKLSPEKICKMSEPLEPLNKEWAEALGLDEYAAELKTAPCAKCGQSTSAGIQWAHRDTHKTRLFENHITEIHPKNGEEEIINGYLCNECTTKLHWFRIDPNFDNKTIIYLH